MEGLPQQSLAALHRYATNVAGAPTNSAFRKIHLENEKVWHTRENVQYIHTKQQQHILHFQLTFLTSFFKIY